MRNLYGKPRIAFVLLCSVILVLAGFLIADWRIRMAIVGPVGLIWILAVTLDIKPDDSKS